MTTVADALASLPTPAESWASTFALGPCPAQGITLADLPHDRDALDRLLAASVQHVEKRDDMLAAAYFLGGLAWEVSSFLGGLWLNGWRPAAIEPGAMAVVSRLARWEYGEESGMTCVLDLTLDPSGITTGGDPAALGQIMQTLHAPMVAAVSQRTGLGQAALWRLVGDGLSGTLLERGKESNRVGEAISTGQAILRDRATRLFSKQTEYVEVRVPADATPETATARDWFRLRGGCCRYYTTEGDEYCTTCVLRDRDDQIKRLREHLILEAAA